MSAIFYFFKMTRIWLSFLTVFLLLTSIWAKPEKPHVLLIVADDLGFFDTSIRNGKKGPNTPNLSKLAQNGVVLDNYYVQFLCTPTRGALLSSRYPIRDGMQDSVIIAGGFGRWKNFVVFRSEKSENLKFLPPFPDRRPSQSATDPP